MAKKKKKSIKPEKESKIKEFLLAGLIDLAVNLLLLLIEKITD